MQTQFDYYYGKEAEQFSFLRVPKALIKDERFKGLSSDAKLLYSLMLDRMSLSVRNNWCDSENRVYIVYAISAIMDDLGCGKDKAIKVLCELDTVKGVGLIEKKRRGFGRPDIIYIKNFISQEDKTSDGQEEQEENSTGTDTETENETTQTDKNEFQKSEEQTTEVDKTELQKSEKPTTEVGKVDHRSRQNRPQEVGKTDPNNTNINNTNNSYININNTNLIPSIYQYNKQESETENKIDEMDNYDTYINTIKKNIEYDFFMQRKDCWNKKEIFEELYQVMCDIVCVKCKTIKINGQEYPSKLVKSRFMKLNSEHLEYVIECIQNTPNRIKNIKAYMVASLYNAPTTINAYYLNLAHSDLVSDGFYQEHDTFEKRWVGVC